MTEQECPHARGVWIDGNDVLCVTCGEPLAVLQGDGIEWKPR